MSPVVFPGALDTHAAQNDFREIAEDRQAGKG
jgi:hypothetical protein